MSSGKLRRERSGSQERRSGKESDKRSDAASEVPELNEEEYDEEWEHEWEDIDDIDKSNTKYQKPYGKNLNQKWRGRGGQRGQNRFNKWEHRNRTSSDYGMDNNRRPGRKPNAFEEEENLEMTPGEEMTNLKVKIQDGKRFAEPDELEDFEPVGGVRNQQRFSRGKGSRGHHGAGRERWNQGNKFKRSATNDQVDCREVLNRRKRHYSDQECDLREKLLKKDPELGDLREIIDSRDPGFLDLRDMIEPPDMNFMDEISEDVVGEVDMDEDISLRIQNEYYNAGAKVNRVGRNFHRDDFEINAEHYDFVEEQDVVIPHDELSLGDEDTPQQENWQQDRWRQGRGGSGERNSTQQRGWSERSKRDSLSEEEWRGPHNRRGTPPDRVIALRGRSRSPGRKNRDLSNNRSRERIRSPLPREMRNRSFERGARQSWERERSFERVASRERVPNLRVQRRGSFEEEIRLPERNLVQDRIFSSIRGGVLHMENQTPPMNDERRLPRSSPPQQDRGRERNLGRMRSISPENARAMNSDRSRRSRERSRGRRSISAERLRISGRSVEREGIRGIARERVRSPGAERNWNAGREENRNIGPDRNRSLERLRNRSQSRNSSFDRERSRNFDQDRKRPIQEASRNSRWDRSRSRERIPRVGLSPGRERDRSPPWAGPRTPSEERFRPPVWERPRSPPRIRSPESDRSRSRGRPPVLPGGRTRDHSRGREMEGRNRNQKDIKTASRPKDQERREKVQEQSRRRDFEPTKPQDNQPSRPREPAPFRNMEKESGSNSKADRNRSKEQGNSSKEQGRTRPRSPEHRSLQEKPSKKTPQMLVEEFKQRFIKESGKPEKYARREEFGGKQGRSNTVDKIHDKKLGGGLNQTDSREWENIRDFQERRNQPAVGLPFLDESRRHRENASRPDIGHQDSRGSRNNQIAPFAHGNQAHVSNVADHQKKDQPVVWQNQNITQPYNHSEEDRRRASRWGSPGRRDKSSDHIDSHKSTPHSVPSAAGTHHPTSNGKAGDNYWLRRDAPSLGESLWNKPRSDLPGNAGRDSSNLRSPATKSALSPREVIFVRGLARDISEMDLRKDISNCGLWPKDVRIVYDTESGVSRGLAFITFNSVDEATRWMDVRKGVLNLRPNNHAPMDYSNPVSKDWECVRCHSVNFKHRAACFQCNRSKDDCLDGWEETCPYPTNALLLRGLNPLTNTADIIKALKPRMIAQARLDSVKMGIDVKGRPRSVCFVQLTSVVDSMSLHKSLVNEPLTMDNCQVIAAYCQLDKLPPMEPLVNQLLHLPGVSTVVPTVLPLSMHPTHAVLPSSNNIPVVSRAPPPICNPPKPVVSSVSTASIRSMLEGNYTEKDIPTLAQYCASAYAKNPLEQAAYVRYYTKLYKEKLTKNQTGGK